MNKKQIIGIGIFAILVALIIGIKVLTGETGSGGIFSGPLTDVYVATGGGKEDFLADEGVVKILKEKYKLNVVYDTWSNGKTITWPLIREMVGEGDKNIVSRISNGETFTIKSQGVSTYDALFTSGQRFYD